MGKRIVLALLLLQSAAAPAAEPEVKDLFEAVHRSVVLVRTFERMVVARDSIGFVPISDLGSGVLISPEGDVLTAAHLVQAADLVQVELADGSTVGASIVASEPAADLALLRLERVPEDAVTAPLGDSDQIQVGERIFIIGAPYGLTHSLTVGYISARHPPATLGGTLALAEFFQTDAAINRGNSGGPMFNLRGEVIGIVSYILSQSGGFEGVGFAVTGNSARDLLLERRSPWSGITVFGLQGTLARALNLPQATGMLVQRVAKGSPGARIGLLPGFLPARIGKQELLLGGDVILEVDGIIVGSAETYGLIREHLAAAQPGQTITVNVLRHGQPLALSMVVEE